MSRLFGGDLPPGCSVNDIENAMGEEEPMDTIPFPDKKYSIIYADPPWSYGNFQGKGKAFGDVSAHYRTMSLSEMSALPVNNIASDDLCLLFMWATFPTLPDAMELMKAWGFEYKTAAFVWVKTRGEKLYSGLGFYTNSNAEVCFVARRGKSPFVRANRDVKQIVQAPLGTHSRKPGEVRDRIVRLVGDVPRIEMFARESAPGWDAWGNDPALSAAARQSGGESSKEA